MRKRGNECLMKRKLGWGRGRQSEQDLSRGVGTKVGSQNMQVHEGWDRAGAEATHFSEARQMVRSLAVLIRGFREQDVAEDGKS